MQQLIQRTIRSVFMVINISLISLTVYTMEYKPIITSVLSPSTTASYWLLTSYLRGHERKVTWSRDKPRLGDCNLFSIPAGWHWQISSHSRRVSEGLLQIYYNHRAIYLTLFICDTITRNSPRSLTQLAKPCCLQFKDYITTIPFYCFVILFPDPFRIP